MNKQVQLSSKAGSVGPPWSRVPGGCEHSVVLGMHSGPLEEQCMRLLAKLTLQIILFISDGLGWTFTRGERKAALTLRGSLSGKALSTKQHLSRNATATETLAVLICSKSPFKDTVSETTSNKLDFNQKENSVFVCPEQRKPQRCRDTY